MRALAWFKGSPVPDWDRFHIMTTEELEIRLGEIEYELRPVRLPFRSFGDYEREQRLSVEAGYIQDELGTRS